MKLNRRKLAIEIAGRLKKGESAGKLSQEIAAYLIDTNSTSELNSLLRDITQIRADRDGIVELTATSAFPLSPEQANQIEDLAKKQYPLSKQAVIHNDINPDVIGGVSLSLPSARLDLTIKAKLNKLKALTA